MMRNLRNKSGMVMMLVIAVVITMSLLVIGLMSRNISRSLTVENQVQEVDADTVAKGAFWKAYTKISKEVAAGATPESVCCLQGAGCANGVPAPNPNPVVVSTTTGTRSYTVTYILCALGQPGCVNNNVGATAMPCRIDVRVDY
ncbi:MAG: hypothetical protein HQL16_00455 [Candidatus Omnitrophica bacterium]|nr:hypothetical protein [Candidatus Omnitrophota bacterium]